MATESERKRFHLEQIIGHISEESSLMKTGSFHPILVPNDIPEQAQKVHLLGDRELSALAGKLHGSVSDSTSDEDTLNDKDERIGVDESTIPTKISPRCDVCGLLHFKSYRCLTRFTAPTYLRRVFDDTTEKIRVCRKCLASKENCVENVAISSLASYSSQIRQMKIPLGMTSERRTRAFEFVVRDLKHLKNGRRYNESDDSHLLTEHTANLETSSIKYSFQPIRKNMLQKFSVDDPIEKNLFLKELNLYSTDIMKNMSQNSDYDMQDACDESNGDSTNDQRHCDVAMPTVANKASDEGKAINKAVYHVAAKDVPSTNVSEKKIGEMFDARKGMNHDLVVHTKRAWKPNKKYDDLRKVERTSSKKESKRKQAKSALTSTKLEKSEKTDQPDKIRTCGINCAVCTKHVQKSYSCCTLQTAPEKYKHLFTPGVMRLKICRKCIPYKKSAKVENQNLIKKKTKIKQKRGRKPKSDKPGTIVKEIRTMGNHVEKCISQTTQILDREVFTTEPIAPVMARDRMVNVSVKSEDMDMTSVSENTSFLSRYVIP